MKFILRDDDISFYYDVSTLQRWFDGVIDLVPISICLVPFIKGDQIKWREVFESHTLYDENDWLADNKIYGLGENKELVKYIKELISNQKVAISLHGIHHRNEEMEMEVVKNNFIRGAEFNTNRDYSNELKESIYYIESLFGVKINSFTPPQNLINSNGLKALKNNHLNLCSDLISPKKIKLCCNSYGITNWLKLLLYRILYKRKYPFLISNQISFIDHFRLQPGSDVDKIKKEFKRVYEENGIFVLSTHTYGFDMKMERWEGNMKDALLDVLKYVKMFDGVEFITIDDLFKRK